MVTKDRHVIANAVAAVLVASWVKNHGWKLIMDGWKLIMETMWDTTQLPIWGLIRDIHVIMEFDRAVVLVRAACMMLFAVYLVVVVSRMLCLQASVTFIMCFMAAECSWRTAAECSNARDRHLAHQDTCFRHLAEARGWANETPARDFLTTAVLDELESLLLKNGTSFQLDVMETASRGLGVFLRGEASPGAIVAIYGGTLRQFTFQQSAAAPITWAKTLWMGSHWLWMHRSECCPRCFLDGVDPAFVLVKHPLAHGQFINHPPAGLPATSGVLPNVMYFGLFNCSPVEGRTLANIRPHLPIAFSNHYTAVAVLLALRRIENEELFADYMLPPPHIRERFWYEPVLTSPCQ